METVKVKEKCKPCKGTGIYVGISERDGSGVVCHSCKGSGCFEFKHEYEVFTKRKKRNDIKRVLEANIGIMVGSGNGCKLEDFGGQPYSDWENGKPFPNGSEMRKYSCPAWWYQSVNYDLKPNWKECRLGGRFSDCSHFEQKQNCWERFDLENKPN